MSEQASAAMGGAQATNGEAGESASDAQEAPQGVDLGPVLEQLGGLQSGLEQLRTDFQRPQEQEQQEPEEPVDDFSWMDAEQGVFDPEAMKAGFQEAIQQAVTQAQQAPLQEIARMRQEQAVNDLVAEYPEIGDEATGKQILSKAQQFAGVVASQSGLPPQQAQQLAQALSSSPAVWREIYRAAKADDAAAGETPADASAAHIQGGSGPSPAAQEEDPLAGVFGPQGGKTLPW